MASDIFYVKSITSRLIKRLLFYLLFIFTLLNHQNLFSITLFITSFIKLLFQHISINIKNVVSQTILVKTA